MPEEAILLKRFFEAVEERLSACSAEQLRSILRNLAAEVAPKDRPGFLEALVPSEDASDLVQDALRQDALLADIDDLVAELREEMDSAEDAYDRYGYGYGDSWDDEDSLGPYESFVAPLVGLFDRTAGVFDCGQVSLARDAYHRLFDALTLEDDYGREVRASDLPETDIQGSRSRYLRALYETEDPARRPERLFAQMLELGNRLGMGSEPILLEDLIRASDRPLPDRKPFLRAWIAFLRQQKGPAADRWLREAIRLLEGTKGLEAFARQEGKAHPRAYLDWLAALKAQGKPAQVVAAARESLRTLPADRPIRAAVADHLCEAAGTLGDSRTVQEGRWEAFRARPSLGRLLDLREATPELKRRARMRRPIATWSIGSGDRAADRSGHSTPWRRTTWRPRPGSIGRCGRMPCCSPATGRPPRTWRPRPRCWAGGPRTTPRAWSSPPPWCCSRAGRPRFPPTWPGCGTGPWSAARPCPTSRRAPRTSSV